MESNTSSYSLSTQVPTLTGPSGLPLEPHANSPISGLIDTPAVVWETKVYEETRSFSFNFDANTTFNETLVPSCSIDGTITFTFNIISADGQNIPNWIKFNDTDFTLTGSIPESYEDQTYSLNLISNWTEQPVGVTSQSITIEVKSLPSPVTAAAKVAVGVAQGQTAAGGVLAGINSILNGSSPTSLWAIVDQLQMVILLLLIDDYTPEDINEYLGGVGFVMFNFNFIPVTDIPYVDIPTDWMTFGDPFDKVEKLGFNSISTFVNNVSLLLSFIVIFIIHMLLK